MPIGRKRASNTMTVYEVNGILVRNMDRFDEWKYAHRYVLTESSCVHAIEQFKNYRLKSPKMTIAEFIDLAATDDIDVPAVRGAVLYMIANRVIQFPMETTEYQEKLLIRLLLPIERRFKVEEITYPQKYFAEHVLTLLA
jgi:hypothetical protein